MLPTPEVCDGKDNNCDGIIDTSAQCPSGFGCRDGQCILQCTGGEMPCPPGYECVNQFCVPQRCQGVTCQPGEKCDENTGACVDLCANIDCGTKTCISGRCLDCNDPLLACTPPQLCIMGACKADPCLTSTARPASTATPARARTCASRASAARRNAAWRASASPIPARPSPAGRASSATR